MTRINYLFKRVQFFLTCEVDDFTSEYHTETRSCLSATSVTLSETQHRLERLSQDEIAKFDELASRYKLRNYAESVMILRRLYSGITDCCGCRW